MSAIEVVARSTTPVHLPDSKVQARHLDRMAMVYVRQSTPQQMVRHQESTRLQYGLVERALRLGWPRERTLVIDDDLGRSAATTEGRPGFQRLVAEVGLDHVGVIFGIEMSRLARSCRDWHQLLEVCAVFGTLIADQDGIYDPSNYNDRLLLGLKGTMSEAELHVLKQRMLQGKLAKARRGELGMALPMGYVHRPSGEVVLDHDEQAQSVIRLLFELFETRGTLHGVLRYLVEHGIQLPFRSLSGANKGELEWRRPNRVSLHNLFRHPIYAGAYVYGKRPTDPRRKQPGRPGTGRTVAGFGEWQVLLKDRLPAYITWQQYENNVKQLAANRQQASGTPRRGPALLAGLVRCGRCGSRLNVTYGGGYLRYACNRATVDYGEALCLSIAGRVLDEKVTSFVLRALEPASLEVSLQVAENVEAERRRLDQQWRQRLERAKYEADRAYRQFNAVEPENRLVARTFEKKLEETLAVKKSIDEEHDRFLAERPTVLSEEERASIRELASNIPSLWNASTTTTAERQVIIRQLVDEILLTVEGDSEQVRVDIGWTGGHRTETAVIRPVARFEQLSYYDDLVGRIRELCGEELSSTEIATQLNAEGWRPPKRRPTFNGAMVLKLSYKHQLARPASRKSKRGRPALRVNEWWIPDLAAKLEMPTISLYTWIRRGWARARRVDGAHRPWAVWADANELARLRAFRNAPKRGWRAHSPTKTIARA
jgi:DNA invertase Pin-like site-specific DNA recombinase/intergrase/recombinase